ncbi:MAG TPA: glycoside hydrolase family 38 C-terminal domain-containing protein, partial [Bacillota bacterium]
MALSEEWRDRITDWLNELKREFYRKLGDIQLTGFTTCDHLSMEEALNRPCQPLSPGTQWGAKWEYGWFRGEITLPSAAAGERIVAMIETGTNPAATKNILVLDTGSENLVYVNGQMSGATRSRWYRDLIAYPNQILISRDGVPGTNYQLFFECYAGHGAMPTAVGPVPPGRDAVPEPPPQQVVIGESSFGIWEELLYQLWLDANTLWELRDKLDPNSLRVAEIDSGLRDFATILDFEVPYPRMIATAKAARARLRPLLECINGSTAPTLYAFGHGHIDLAWLWPLAETVRKGARTFTNQLELLKEYPEYRFLQSTPALYRMMQEHYPALYDRIKEAVKNGGIIPEGGMWVEADTNITGGESLIRQFIYGKRFFSTEFGIESQMLWLPDVFGYSGNLPQIMRGCGIKYFATGKLFWNYHGGAAFPYNTFMWKGIDGSEILTHLCDGYGAETSPAPLIRTWETRVQKDGCSARLLPFGWGDGGGGPTRDHLEYLRREKNLEGMPQARIASPLEFFKNIEDQEPIAKYVGELYFQAHRGTYTSQARIKQANRRSELALREAELWSTVAARLNGFEYPRIDLETAWKKVLLNQFHDILPGSSIHRVYEEAETAYRQILDLAGRVTGWALAGFINHAEQDVEALTVFNSLSWERTVLVKLPWSGGAAKADGVILPGQVIDGATLVSLTVPACGWTTLYPAACLAPAVPVQVGDRYLENEFLRVELDDRGALTRILDKEADRELITAPANVFKMYQDIPTRNDAWDIDSFYERTPLELDEPAEIEVLQVGPLLGSIRVTRGLHQSQLVQEISLSRGSRAIEFNTRIDWRERHKLLKVN